MSLSGDLSAFRFPNSHVRLLLLDSFEDYWALLVGL